MICLENDTIYGFEYDDEANCRCFVNPYIEQIGFVNRTAIVILSGGGLDHIQYRELYPVSQRMMGYGFQVFALKYSTGTRSKYAAKELAEGIDLIRKNSTRWDIDKGKIIVMGFSVGGWIATKHSLTHDAFSDLDCEPNALALFYPVISRDCYAHKGSIDNLRSAGLNEDEIEIIDRINPECFPPTFIVHCMGDEKVSVFNSIKLLDKITSNVINKKNEVHFFSGGKHELALGDKCSSKDYEHIDRHYSHWVELFLEWSRDVFDV